MERERTVNCEQLVILKIYDENELLKTNSLEWFTQIHCTLQIIWFYKSCQIFSSKFFSKSIWTSADVIF